MANSHSLQVRMTRLNQARQLSTDPSATLQDLANTWGVSKVAACNYLKKYDVRLQSYFGQRQSKGNLFTREEALWRLRFIRTHEIRGHPRVKIAKLLGISLAGLTQWIERWAPDGVQAAIEDLED